MSNNIEILTPVRPVSTYVGDGVRQLVKDFPFSVIHHNTDTCLEFVIPSRFCWDGASNIRAAWWFASPFTGKYYIAALIHDFAYRTGCMPREYADSLFYECMLRDGVNKCKAWIMYKSVRLFGGSSYNKGVNK